MKKVIIYIILAIILLNPVNAKTIEEEMHRQDSFEIAGNNITLLSIGDKERSVVLCINNEIKIICHDVIYKIIEDRKKKMPEDSYVASLFDKGKDKIIQKVGEESTEVIIAAKNEGKDRIISEVADLIFHLLTRSGSRLRLHPSFHSSIDYFLLYQRLLLQRSCSKK